MSEIRVPQAQLRRRFRHDSFDDLAPGVPVQIGRDRAGGWVLDFDADLTPEQVAAIRLRLTTASDEEAAARVALAQQAEQVAEWTPPAEQAAVAAFARTAAKTARKATTATASTTDAERIAAVEGQVARLTALVADLTRFTTDYPA